jgi:hypothetical protein
MANIITWGIAGLAIGGLMAGIFRSPHFALNLFFGAFICIMGGLMLIPLMDLAPSTFTMALLGLIAGGMATQLLLSSPKNDANAG